MCSCGCGCYHRAPRHVIVYTIPLDQSVFQADDTVSIMRDVIFVCYHDDGVPFVVELLEQIHDIVRSL